MYMICVIYTYNYKNKNTCLSGSKYNMEWQWNVCIRSKCPCLWLLLVLCLCGGVEVIQDALHVLKGGPVLRFVLPAGHHDLIQLGGTVVGPWHPVAALYRGHHLSFGHTWGQRGRHAGVNAGNTNSNWHLRECTLLWLKGEKRCCGRDERRADTAATSGTTALLTEMWILIMLKVCHYILIIML